jgi:hypothetical protein
MVRAEQQARSESARERMEFQIQSEPRDAAFERAVGEQLKAVYEVTDFVGTRFVSLECRSTLCRVTNQHDNREAMSEFARNAAKYPPFNSEVFYKYDKGDPPTSTLYFSRAGTALPHDF